MRTQIDTVYTEMRTKMCALMSRPGGHPARPGGHPAFTALPSGLSGDQGSMDDSVSRHLAFYRRLHDMALLSSFL